MINYIAPIIWLLCSNSLFAQSDATPKGFTGFEAGVGKLFAEGPDPTAAFIGLCLDGQVDLGIGYVGVKDQSAYTIGTGFHFGGEPNDAGLSLNLGYVIGEEDGYAVYGPGVYLNMVSGGLSVIPSLNFEFATVQGSSFAGIFGLSIITEGKVGVAFRPGFAFGRDDKYFFVSVGVISRSKSKGSLN